MIYTGNLGYPRIGKNRELKFGLEKYWNKCISVEELREISRKIKENNWKLHQAFGFDHIPSGYFSLYDHVLDHAVMFDAVPMRFLKKPGKNPEDLYFSMARGQQTADGETVAAMEMTKWFNTNYHYIVPEINPDTQFSLNVEKLMSELAHAGSLCIKTRPVILGPVSFLLLSKSVNNCFSPLSKISDLLPLYKRLFETLSHNGVKWIQLDEPFLSTDLNPTIKSAYQLLFKEFAIPSGRPQIMLTTYFSDLSSNSDILQNSMFEGLHIDLTQTKDIEKVIKAASNTKIFSLGIIDGRNIWRSDLNKKLVLIRKYMDVIGSREIMLAPSCSMLHLPLDINVEDELNPSVKSWLAFAEQKLESLSVLKKALSNDSSVNKYIRANQKIVNNKKESELVHLLENSPDFASVPSDIFTRSTPFSGRKRVQQKNLGLSILPTTTIGSFPQTKEVRRARSKFHKGELSVRDYTSFLQKEITNVIRFQEKIGLDVLVHGEFERNDMVQYFAENLSGFAFTRFGWVQSFGSRYVRPPIIFGDVKRPEPITIQWAKFAQSLTKKYVKGMLTGPVTILQWSFVRNDQPRAETCKQIAFAIRDEVLDLEEAGIKIIQIDEPALREGLPIQKRLWKDYLEWAVKCFQIASSGVRDDTQIHTHMCYAEFNDIINAIIKMDADVISIEASRSKMDLLTVFSDVAYPNEIGPGIYDIHSPNIPGKNEMEELIRKALAVIRAGQLWINPDCGLKTRQWDEIEPSLKNMVAAARCIREQFL
jgi:5-methyltetrahydropteroyltriglutamate--homocysteine methyltransferase